MENSGPPITVIGFSDEGVHGLSCLSLRDLYTENIKLQKTQKPCSALPEKPTSGWNHYRFSYKADTWPEDAPLSSSPLSPRKEIARIRRPCVSSLNNGLIYSWATLTHYHSLHSWALQVRQGVITSEDAIEGSALPLHAEIVYAHLNPRDKILESDLGGVGGFLQPRGRWDYARLSRILKFLFHITKKSSIAARA